VNGYVRFLPLRVHVSSSPHLAIRIQDDLRIELAEGFNPQMLQQVIQILRAS